MYLPTPLILLGRPESFVFFSIMRSIVLAVVLCYGLSLAGAGLLTMTGAMDSSPSIINIAWHSVGKIEIASQF